MGQVNMCLDACVPRSVRASVCLDAACAACVHAWNTKRAEGTRASLTGCVRAWMRASLSGWKRAWMRIAWMRAQRININHIMLRS